MLFACMGSAQYQNKVGGIGKSFVAGAIHFYPKRCTFYIVSIIFDLRQLSFATMKRKGLKRFKSINSFSLFSFPFSPLTVKAVPLLSIAHYANFIVILTFISS